MQVLELSLTILATVLPAILAAVIVLELIGVSRFSKRLSQVILEMESPTRFDSFLNSIVPKKTTAKPSVVIDTPSTRDVPIVAEVDSTDDDDIEPIIVTSFDFIEATNPESTLLTKAEGQKRVEKDSQEAIPFGDIAFQDASFSDFELIVSEDGSFELKESEMEEEE